jgi:hypothetical protein
MDESCSKIALICVAPLILSVHNSWCWWIEYTHTRARTRTHTHTHTHTHGAQWTKEMWNSEWYASELSISHCPHDTRHLNYITIWVLYYLLISWLLVTLLHIHLSSSRRPVFCHYLPSILSSLCSHYVQNIVRCTWLQKCCTDPLNWYTCISLWK